MKILCILFFLPLMSFAQFQRDEPRIAAYDFVMSRQIDDHLIWRFGGDQDRNLYHRGFAITNFGPNHIITEPPTDFLNTPSREYFFISDDFSKRDTYLWITDYNGSGRVSDFLETIMVFIPRINPVGVVEMEETLDVSLPTGELVSFFKKYKTLDSHIMTEEPVDLNPDRSRRQNPPVYYHGEGLVIRSDAKGSDPRLVKSVKVMKAGQKSCTMEARLFWTQEGHPKFRFIEDQDVIDLIVKHCGKNFEI